MIEIKNQQGVVLLTVDADSLQGANLQGANLEGANLQRANLQRANLRSANLADAKLPRFQIPQEGELTVFKKLAGGTIAKLKVPASAKRTASLVGRKCRADFVEVLEGSGVSAYDRMVTYHPGDVVKPHDYDPDPRIECTSGIHFFLTREEAEEYDL
jgi:hypothetical protein